MAASFKKGILGFVLICLASASSVANTSSGGLFFDWGGDSWGARLGFHVVSASFDYEDGPVSGTIDGSGNSIDIGIRVAF